MFTDLKFSWYKDGEFDVKRLIKAWNDNFHIIELPIEKGKIKDGINFEYELIVYRNKSFKRFYIPFHMAQYLIWALNLTTFMKSSWNSYYRVFYNKSAHSKVMYGYKSEYQYKYEDEYPSLNKKK